MTLPIRRVAIVDDDLDSARTIKIALEDADFQVSIVPQEINEIDKIVEAIRTSADAAICDHRLRYGGRGDLEGAELAARLIEIDIPAIVVTQYLDQEQDVSIRKYRAKLPVVLRRRDASEPDLLRKAFADCLNEMRANLSGERTPYETLLRVTDIQKLGDDEVADAIVYGWDASDAVRFPLALVPASVRQSMMIGTVLKVKTNFRTQEKGELYFTDFSIAPEPDDDDGLA